MDFQSHVHLWVISCSLLGETTLPKLKLVDPNNKLLSLHNAIGMQLWKVHYFWVTGFCISVAVSSSMADIWDILQEYHGIMYRHNMYICRYIQYIHILYMYVQDLIVTSNVYVSPWPLGALEIDFDHFDLFFPKKSLEIRCFLRISRSSKPGSHELRVIFLLLFLKWDRK